MTTAYERVRVELKERAYDIIIGQALISHAGDFVRPLLRPGRDRVFIVSDDTVARLHGSRLQEALVRSGLTGHLISVPPGEDSKSFAYLDLVLAELIGAGAERDDLIIGFGGGVVGDLTGLAAGLLKRGARFVQIPTTLLAQVDSSVGGKTAINSSAGKNMIGLFHQPALVLADLEVLGTLPARELRAGLAEVVKYAFIDNPSFFTFLESNASCLLAGQTSALAEAVRISCLSKARIVAMDETEQAERALLNLGHTFGHALERANNFRSTLLHGEAVGVGMAMAFRYSVIRGVCSTQDAINAERLLNTLGLATRIADLGGGPYHAAELLAHMAHDKKARNGELTLILLRGVGHAFIERGVALPALQAFLERETSARN